MSRYVTHLVLSSRDEGIRIPVIHRLGIVVLRRLLEHLVRRLVASESKLEVHHRHPHVQLFLFFPVRNLLECEPTDTSRFIDLVQLELKRHVLDP
jgi:hypothetical protein